MNSTKLTYEIVFRDEDLKHDPQIGKLISEEHLFENTEEGIENPVISRTYTRVLTVKSANLRMSVLHEQMLYEYQKREEQKLKDKQEIDVVMQVLETAYFPLAASSSGEVPTFYEFSEIMADDEAERWGTLARAINPHWWGIEKKRM